MKNTFGSLLERGLLLEPFAAFGESEGCDVSHPFQPCLAIDDMSPIFVLAKTQKMMKSNHRPIQLPWDKIVIFSNRLLHGAGLITSKSAPRLVNNLGSRTRSHYR